METSPGPPVALNGNEANQEDGEVVFTLEVGPATCGVVEDGEDVDGVDDEPEPAVPVVVAPVSTG